MSDTDKQKEDYFLFLTYKEKRVKFKVTNPDATLDVLMNNLRHAVGKDGKLIFDFVSIDGTGAPLEYFFGKDDPASHEIWVLRPKIGNREQGLLDYNVQNGDSLYIIPDPFPG